MRPIAHILVAAAILLAPSAAKSAAKVRVKELANIQGVRDNELFGYGLVVGLSGTGDTERVFFTSQSISGMLGRLGIRVDPKEIRVRNVAAVMVTARLPPFARPGSRIDVTVGSMGNARSLSGGVLLVTPLTATDGAVYAVAQGSVQLGGFEASSSGSALRKNSTTSGRIPLGATVERAVLPNLGAQPLVLDLKRADFTTASRMAAALNSTLGENVARALDPAAVEVQIPEDSKEDVVGLLAKIEMVEVEADQRAKIVISERTGTVVAGDRVRIRPVAVAHGGLQVTVNQQPVVSQPNPFAPQGAQTTKDKVAAINAREESRATVGLPATSTVEDLVKSLNLLGATPRDLIAILQAIKAAGALDADLEVL
jgi:flagellar P-ring protein precursor FlgI